MISLYEFLVKDKKKINKGEYIAIDLDLPSGLKWANMNVGAEKPEDYGLYFQWGRSNGYKYGDNGFISFDEYKTTSGTEYKSNETLKPEDDGAHVNMGDNWRMPTAEELNELVKHTNNEFTELNGVNGRKFTSKTDDSKWIFIPAAGYFMFGEGFIKDKSIGKIWSSLRDKLFEDCSYRLSVSSRRCSVGYEDFDLAFSIRGVCE